MARPSIIVIGAGMAGLSCASHAAEFADVTVLEAESQPGYHSSGRSAAAYIEPYINATVHALTTASRGFFERPPDGFTEAPLVSPRADVMIAAQAKAHLIDDYLAKWSPLCPDLREVPAADALAQVPALRVQAVHRAVTDPNVLDIDVHALLEGFRRLLMARGGSVVTNARVTAVERRALRWSVETADASFAADLVVNAAGAWGEQVAALAGAGHVGLVPKRRTALLIDAPGFSLNDWPIVHEVESQFYFKPDAGRLLLSPADETPSEPCDAQPEELDVAIAIDRFERATTIPVRRVVRRWAGLRSFVADKMPVVGFDAKVDGFFWLVGQGGFGIQTSPAMGRLSAALLSGRDVPADIAARGVTAAALTPSRLQT
ncbi:MAG: FAD-binding oxidoreductase [Gammaproteobacteria bacterium]|nr:FAD-binding oxidoreductase [Gammaproteobacteria bacterium]